MEVPVDLQENTDTTLRLKIWGGVEKNVFRLKGPNKDNGLCHMWEEKGWNQKDQKDQKDPGWDANVNDGDNAEFTKVNRFEITLAETPRIAQNTNIALKKWSQKHLILKHLLNLAKNNNNEKMLWWGSSSCR